MREIADSDTRLMSHLGDRYYPKPKSEKAQHIKDHIAFYKVLPLCRLRRVELTNPLWRRPKSRFPITESLKLQNAGNEKCWKAK